MIHKFVVRADDKRERNGLNFGNRRNFDNFVLKFT